jgi:hypothetical protein
MTFWRVLQRIAWHYAGLVEIQRDLSNRFQFFLKDKCEEPEKEEEPDEFIKGHTIRARKARLVAYSLYFDERYIGQYGSKEEALRIGRGLVELEEGILVEEQ